MRVDRLAALRPLQLRMIYGGVPADVLRRLGG